MRPLRLLDNKERAYDSCLPELPTMLSIDQVSSDYTYLGDNVPAFVEPNDDYWITEKQFTTSIITQFPFVGNPGRRIDVPIGILSASSNATRAGSVIASSPIDVTGVELDPLADIFKVRNSFISRAPADDRYSIISPPNYLIGSDDPVDLTENLVSYYRPNQLSSDPMTSLNNLVPGSDAATNLTGLRGTTAGDGPGRSNGSPLFPVSGLYTGRGATIYFEATGTGTDVELLVAGDANDHKMASGGSDVSFSISVTFKLSTLGSSQYLVTRRRSHSSQSTLRIIEYSVHVNSSGQVVFRKGRSNPNNQAYVEVTTMANVISADTWHHIVVTFTAPDSSQLYEIYVDGQSRGYTVNNAGSSPSDVTATQFARLRIGANAQTASGAGVTNLEAVSLGIPAEPYSAPTPDAATEIRDGNIHSVAIWKGRALSAADVSNLYNLELVGSAVGDLRHRAGRNTLGIEKSVAFRYGISNVEPEVNASVWNHKHFGHVRDMFEPRKLFATSEGFRPVKVRFTSGSQLLLDPTDTHTQNLSTFATSSMPYFDDGVARNRNDNPDETLLSAT